MKRLLSMILVLTLLVGMLPLPASATESNAEVTNDDVTIEGTNGFGNLLSDDIQTEYEEEMQYSGGYGVTDLTIAGNTAVVEYHTLEEATLVVAIYSEDKMQMITSGKAEASPDFTEATVAIDGTMPEYFHASAYLVDNYDYSPLCEAYDTPMYTRAMQDLLDATVDDFDPQLILNLDDDKTTNFAVFAEDTSILEEQAGVNTVVSVNDDTMTYVIENADESITGLQPGDILAYPYGDNNILIVKIASISLSGTTATITGAELEMEEVFSHVKVEADGNAGNVTVDESTGDGITYTGMGDSGSTYDLRNRAWEGEGEGEMKLNFELYKRKYSSDDKQSSLEVEGSLSLNFTVGFSYYIALESHYITFDLDYAITSQIEVKGKHTGEIAKFPSFGFEPIPCVYIGFEPALVLEFEGTFTLGLTYTGGVSFHFEKDQGIKRYSKKPILDINLEVEGKIFFGIDMGPHIDILRGAVFEMELSTLSGAELTAKLTGKLHLLGEEERGASIHDCNLCLSADVAAKSEFSLKMTFLKMKKLSVKFKLALLKYDIGCFYLSFDNMELGWGSCPYIRYQTIYIVKSENGEILPDHEIFSSTGDSLGKTDEHGQLIEYLPEGIYVVGTVIGEKEISKRFEIKNKAQRVILRSDSGTGPEYGIFSTIDSISITDYGAVIAGGNCGPLVDGQNSDDVIWTLYENGALILTGEGPFVVPYGESWKNYDYATKYLAICDGITGIPDQAFWDFSYTVEIVVADTVQEWGRGCFADCYNLQEVTLPVDCTVNLSSSPFDGCFNVESIHYTSGMTGIMTDRNTSGNHSNYTYEQTMEYDSRAVLKHVEFEEGVKHIGASAFYKCSELTNVELPSTLESIGASAFYENSSLQTLNLPYGLTELGASAFYGCTALTDLVLPDTLTSIPQSAFYKCSGLTEIEIPDSVTSIENIAFYGCTGIRTVYIPDTVQTWGSGCFSGCTGLKEVTLPVDYTTNNTIAPFDGCKNVEYIHYTSGATGIMVDRNEQNPYFDYAYEKTMEFDSRGVLKRVEFDEGVKHIGASAFYKCSALTNAEFPSTLESIGASAFYENNNLQTLNLPYGLTELGASAFYGCTALTDLVLPDTLTSIPQSAFYNCSGLTEIEIPDSVTSIESNAFYGCTGIRTLYIPDTVQTWGSGCFGGCTGLKEVTLPVDYTANNTIAPFDGCNNVEYIHYTGGATGIMADRNQQNQYFDYAYEKTMEFDSRGVLKRVEFDEGAKHIGATAFYGCTELTEVKISSTMESIGSGAFYGVTADVYYPADSDYWTADTMLDYGGYLTWIPYTLNENSEMVIPEDVTEVTEVAEAVDGQLIESPDVTESVVPETAIPEISEETSIMEEIIPQETIEETLPEETVPETTETQETETISDNTVPAGWELLTEPEPFAEETTPEETLPYVIQSLSVRTVLEPVEESETITVNEPVANALIGGNYSSEMGDDGTDVKVASFRNLVPGEQYVLLVLKSLESQEPLGSDNLLYISQAAAGEDGKLEFRYIPREDPEVTYVVACGAANQSLKDAVITIPEMTATGNLQAVEPVVMYKGKQLVENQDYTLLGQLSAVKPGEYTFYIRGIYHYSGLVACQYTILPPTGDLDCDGSVTVTDVQYLIWHTLFPEMYPLDETRADFDNSEDITDADAVTLLWSILFPEVYPL